MTPSTTATSTAQSAAGPRHRTQLTRRGKWQTGGHWRGRWRLLALAVLVTLVSVTTLAHRFGPERAGV